MDQIDKGLTFVNTGKDGKPVTHHFKASEDDIAQGQDLATLFTPQTLKVRDTTLMLGVFVRMKSNHRTAAWLDQYLLRINIRRACRACHSLHLTGSV
jgi:hypothetical protein